MGYVDDILVVSYWCRISAYGIHLLMKSGTMDPIVLPSYRFPSPKFLAPFLSTSLTVVKNCSAAQ